MCTVKTKPSSPAYCWWNGHRFVKNGFKELYQWEAGITQRSLSFLRSLISSCNCTNEPVPAVCRGRSTSTNLIFCKVQAFWGLHESPAQSQSPIYCYEDTKLTSYINADLPLPSYLLLWQWRSRGQSHWRSKTWSSCTYFSSSLCRFHL